MLLNKHNLNLTQFTGDENPRYALNAIHVTENETVATNDHVLVRVTTPKGESEANFPTVEGFEPHPEFKPFNLHADDAKEILKAIPKDRSVPVLNHARFASNGSVKAAVTTIGASRVFTPRIEPSGFPNWQSVMPKGDPIASVSLNADYLAELAKAAGKMANARSRAIKLRVYDHGSYKSVSITATCEETGQTFESVVMPVRD